MLKKRDLIEVPTLFELSVHPQVYPYIRQKAATVDEFYFSTKQIIEAENNNELISRTIMDEYEQPIGTITLYDIEQRSGFLATWIGQPFFGKGYNQMAKLEFLQHLYLSLNIETVFMKVRKTNGRSLSAMTKIPYVIQANELYPEVYERINASDDIYNLLSVSKEHFLTHHQLAVMEQKTNNVNIDVVS